METCRVSGLLWHSEGIGLVLPGSQVQEIVRGEIGGESRGEDHGESDETGAVAERGEEGEEEYPEDCVVHEPDERTRVRESLFDRYVVRCVLAKPCEPQGGVILHDQSEESSQD